MRGHGRRAFGSVLLPVKAIVMNVLSLSAMYGTVVRIFQDGHFSGLLGFTPTASIDPGMPILLLAIMFGLSTDYEVFLLSRVREQYDRSHDNTPAVAARLQRTGAIITSAAFLLLVVIAAFSRSGIAFIKRIQPSPGSRCEAVLSPGPRRLRVCCRKVPQARKSVSEQARS